MAKPTYHHGDLRTALLDAAEKELLKDPDCVLSVRSLASKIGVSATAPHAHFSTKSDLLAALATRGFERLREDLLEAPQDKEDLRMMLTGLAERYIAFGVKNTGLYRLMFTTGVGLETKAELRLASRTSYDVLRDAIRSAFPDHAKTETDTYALTAWALVHGFTSLLSEDRIADDLIEDGSGRALADIVTALLMAGQPDKP